MVSFSILVPLTCLNLPPRSVYFCTMASIQPNNLSRNLLLNVQIEDLYLLGKCKHSIDKQWRQLY